jgi:hypothetical protein
MMDNVTHAPSITAFSLLLLLLHVKWSSFVSASGCIERIEAFGLFWVSLQ